MLSKPKKTKNPKLFGHPKPRKYKTLEQKNTQELIGVADEWFSKYVRLRDSEWQRTGWYGVCISCTHRARVAWIDKTGKLRFDLGWDAGHYVKRGNKVVRFDEMNVNLQCKYHCNKMLSGNVEKYRLALMDKYGVEVPDDLTHKAQKTTYYKFTKSELLEIIDNSKTEIDYIVKETKRA